MGNGNSVSLWNVSDLFEVGANLVFALSRKTRVLGEEKRANTRFAPTILCGLLFQQSLGIDQSHATMFDFNNAFFAELGYDPGNRFP